jgi:hypothetical protein
LSAHRCAAERRTSPGRGEFLDVDIVLAAVIGRFGVVEPNEADLHE